MAMNPMQKKARTSFLLGMFLTLIITGIIIGLLILQISKMKEEQAAIEYRSVYVLAQDVISGDNLEGNLKLEQVRAEHAPNNALTSANFATYITENSTAKIGVRKGTVITTDMINQEGKERSSDVRIQEYNMLVLPTQLEEGQHIDVRLRLPSGEDFIVLSKKRVDQTNSDTVWIEVSEDEILTMSNAIVEAYIMEGSLLYATTYADAGMQGNSTPTYIASQSVISLMNANPNITTTAMNALSSRYTEAARNQRGTINQAVDGYGDEKLTNVEAGVSSEAEKMKAARQQYVGDLSTY